MSAPVIANLRRIQMTTYPSTVSRPAVMPARARVGRAGVLPSDDTAVGGRRPHRWLRTALVVLGTAFGVILWGGYTQGWDWTGVSDKDTLWHWLQLLMVPIAFAALPGVLRDHRALHRGRKLVMLGLAVAFVGFVVISYVVPWEWTGFTGNTLWDWLSLLLLPIAITSVRFIRAERTLTWAHYGSAAVLLVGFAVLIFFGYIAPWDWTGFTGNTVLDWVQLLILPVLFPTVVVPAAAAWLTERESAASQAGAGTADASR